MIPILYETITEGTVPTHYGIGPLTDCLSCQVTEERNGAYELALTYPTNGIHAQDILWGRFIMAKPNYMDGPQIFRINKVGRTMAGKFTVSAYHISYDLSGKVIQSGTAASAGAACALLTASAGAFNITTDKTTVGAFKITTPSSVRSWFGGKDGSIVDIYGGEWAYDNYGASLKAARGQDRGVTIRYGKNLTQLSQVLDMSNLCTGIIPYYVDQNNNITTGARVPTGLTLDAERDKAVDFSQDIQPESATPILTQLANLAAAYIAGNNLTAVSNSITLDFIQEGNITERVDLCDTVAIYFEALGISVKSKCVKTTWDVLQDRYSKATFGQARANIADTIAQNSRELTETPTRSEMNRATELITGNRGGYLMLHDSDGDGLPDELLIMNTPDKATATKVWRWNKSGLGYSSTGYAGPYGLAMTSEGEIDADFIKVGVIQDVNANFTLDMTSGDAVMKNFKAKTRFDLINSSDTSKGFMHINPNGDTILWLYSASSTNPLVKIWAADANGSGAFNLLKANGNAILEAGLTSESGGGVGIRNSSNQVIGEFRTNSYGGAVTLYNNSGGSVCELNAASAGDGVLQLRDSIGTATIYGFAQSGQLVCVTLYQTSSRKAKKNIKDMTAEDAKAILALQAVSFDFINEAQGKDKRGFIAEDVAEIIPGLVTPETEDRPASLDYVGMIPYLQAVIKDQENRISALEEKIKQIGG